MNDPAWIDIVPHSPQWSEIFNELAKIYRRSLGDLCLRVEHVGSTAISGLAAKPILDIDIVIADRNIFPQVEIKLRDLGYTHQGDKGIPDREAFQRENEYVPRDGSDRKWMQHHLYVCPSSSRELQRHIIFRDYIRTHPEDQQAYATLKRQLAERFTTNREQYTEAKTAFIESILKKAKKSIDRSLA